MIDDLDDYAAHFAARALADALTAANRVQLLERAATFEAAKPRPGDFHGQSTRDDLSALWLRCDQKARALRAAADVGLLRILDQTPAPIMCPICGTPTSPWSCSCGETRTDGEQVAA